MEADPARLALLPANGEGGLGPGPPAGAAPPGQRHELPGAGSRVAPGPGGATRVLLVEDDFGTRGLLEMLLSLRGHRVEAFSNAEQAWAAYQREPFPLVVLDWVLPGMDGLELCRRIRAADGGSDSVILIVTARDRSKDIAAMIEAGATDYLTKPFDAALFEVRLTIAEQQVRGVADRKRAARLEADRNRVLELIAGNEPLGDVLNQVARLVERQRQDVLCAVLAAREGALYYEAAPGLAEPFVRATNGLTSGPIAAAIARREALLTADLADDPLWEGYREPALSAGLRACWAVPLLVGVGPAPGALVVFGHQPGPPSSDDLELLAIVGRLAALAIEHARLFDQAALVDALRGLSRLKSEFLNTASHELRTPLSLIHGYAELLMVRAPTLAAAEVAEMATEIHSGSRTMARLVDDLLDFSRIEQDRLRLDRRRVEVGELLHGLVEAFRPQPGGDRIRAELPPALAADVDPERLAQIVGNLLSNALRYAPDGPIVLRATRRKGWLRIEVTDQGPGIPPAEQPLVWEKFYRGSHALESPIRGSGLGLAVVKHLVELQQGRVGLRSGPGRGTTVWFGLPADA